MKNSFISYILIAGITSQSYSMHQPQTKIEETERAMKILNLALDNNTANDQVEGYMIAALSTQLLQNDKYHWYHAEPFLHATIALKLAKTKAKHAAKLSCEREQNFIKRIAPLTLAFLEEDAKLSRLEREYQNQWINAELNLASIKLCEKRFDEQIKRQEK